MKIMLSAGETSGDLHGAAIARELKTLDEDIALVGFGGDNMEKAGVSLWANYKSYNVMGVLEVILNLRRILKLLDYLTEKMKEEKPDLLVLIDYPDFNWRLAKRAKELGIKVFSYIPPSAWAWRKGRATDCAKIADEFVAIFPHELPPYLEAGAKISFLGNPLVDAVKPTMTRDDARQRFGAKDSDRIVLLLPGSREQEIRRIFPAMLGAAVLLKKHQPRTKFYLPIAEGIDESLLKEYISVSGAEATLTKENRYDLFQIAEFAIATSGTVVMEAALLGLPSVVLYKMSGFNFFIAKLFVHIDYFSLPNLVLQKKALTELLQDDVSPKKIFEEAKKLYVGENEREDVAKDLAKIRDILGEEGATKRIAEKILEVCKK